MGRATGLQGAAPRRKCRGHTGAHFGGGWGCLRRSYRRPFWPCGARWSRHVYLGARLGWPDVPLCRGRLGPPQRVAASTIYMRAPLRLGGPVDTFQCTAVGGGPGFFGRCGARVCPAHRCGGFLTGMPGAQAPPQRAQRAYCFHPPSPSLMGRMLGLGSCCDRFAPSGSQWCLGWPACLRACCLLDAHATCCPISRWARRRRRHQGWCGGS